MIARALIRFIADNRASKYSGVARIWYEGWHGFMGDTKTMCPDMMQYVKPRRQRIFKQKT